MLVVTFVRIYAHFGYNAYRHVDPLDCVLCSSYVHNISTTRIHNVLLICFFMLINKLLYANLSILEFHLVFANCLIRHER